MELIREIRRRAGAVLWPALLIAVAAYFAYYAVEGERGLIAYFRLGDEIEKAAAGVAATAAKRDLLAHRVALLQRTALDPDMLEEQARRVLGLAHPDEVVIYQAD